VVVGTEFASDFNYRLHLLMRVPLIQDMLSKILADRQIPLETVSQIAVALEELLHSRWPELTDETGSFSASSLAVRIAKTWDFMGGACAVDSEATSSMAALQTAIDSLVCEDCNLMICVGAQRNMSPSKYQWLQRAGKLASADDLQNPAPFDRENTRYWPGEGCGVLLMKRHRDALRAGDTVHAVLRGTSVHHKNLLDGVRESAAETIAQSFLESERLRLLMTDAAGIVDEDELLARAAVSIAALTAPSSPLQLTSVVGQIGHTGGASAMASLIAAILSLGKNRAYPVAGLQNPLPILTREAEKVACPTQPGLLAKDDMRAKRAGLVISHGKGLAWSAVCECVPEPANADVDQGEADVATQRLPPSNQAASPVVPPSAVRSKSVDAELRVARRSVLRLVDAPTSDSGSESFQPDSAVIVIGANPVADALCRHLGQSDVTIYQLAPRDGWQAVVARLEEISDDTPPRYVFLVPDSDAEQSAHRQVDWLTWRERELELPFQSLQRWCRQLVGHESQESITLGAVTRMGGTLGLSGTVTSPVGGWVGGVLKSLRIELKRRQLPVTLKLCDFDENDSPAEIVRAFIRELANERPEAEIAFQAGRRRAVRVEVEPAEPLLRQDVTRGSTWVLTGGARGITAEVAVGLGRAYGGQLHLIGRSPLPQADVPWRNCTEQRLREIKRSIVRQAIREKQSPEKQWDRVKADMEIYDNLQRMQQLGLAVTYHSCDVSDRVALEQVLGLIRRQSGPIEGIIHGAGYARSGRLEMVKPERLRTTISAKVGGAVALMELTRNDPLRYFVGFGSISGRYGGNGLSDYAGANGMLARLCTQFRSLRTDCATSCIDWQSWDEVGMAMVPESATGTRGVLKMKFIPPAEGVGHLLRELSIGLPEGEVLIDDGEFESLL
jgi:NAD(P)-dependent dehydrogenase (short-subunit alcohol dehydrogenase family)